MTLSSQSLHATGSNRLLFACYHFYIDPSNGAAITSREILRTLGKCGWDVRVFCGPLTDFSYEERIPQIIADRHITPKIKSGQGNTVHFSLLEFQDEQMESVVYLPQSKNKIPSQEEGMIFLGLFQNTVAKWRPQIVMTYGGFWMARSLLDIAHQHHAKNVFSLRNFAYKNAELFQQVDLTLVPSQFASDWYAEKLGIKSTPIPSPIDWDATLGNSDMSGKKYVTFVNPDPSKGVFLFAQVAKQLWERRPEIPLLVVEGRCGADWLARTGVDLRGVKNISLMPNTPDPRDFYRVTKIMFVPSIFMETFGRVAAEAMINGIPVVGSSRGALPEVIGDAGLTLDIPAQYTPDTRTAPTPEEVEPWVQAIIRLWDDAEFYNELSTKGKARSERWHPEIIAKQYDDALTAMLVK